MAKILLPVLMCFMGSNAIGFSYPYNGPLGAIRMGGKELFSKGYQALPGPASQLTSPPVIKDKPADTSLPGPDDKKQPKLSHTISQVYDYIVVGGGNAGLAVANRLTEDPNITVAVLEAGPNAENLPEVYVPGLSGTGKSFTSLNWAYKTVPQENLGGRISVIGAGKALGGGTTINSMIFTCAERGQYDAWGRLNKDNPNWTWDTLLPYFKKAELFSPPNQDQLAGGARYQDEFHGTSSKGRVKVGYPNYFYTQSEMWRQATGFESSPDLSNGNSQGMVGVSSNSLDPRNNTRCSSACAYYTPFADRPNLTVLTDVLVTKVLWESRDALSFGRLRASGVEFKLKDGQTSQLEIRKEVILSAGTIGSPKILELSGVGNATILGAAGVEIVLHLPTVGENLADHVHNWANVFTNASLTRDALRYGRTFMRQQTELWHHNRTGMLSAAPRSLSLALPSQLFPQFQFTSFLQTAKDNLRHYAQAFSNGNTDLAKGIEWQHALMLKAWEEDRSSPVELNFEPGYSGPTTPEKRPARKYSSINAVLIGPLSRGRTHITSANASESVALDPAYYAHPLDIVTHVKGVQLGRKMLSTPPLDSIYEGEYEPGLDKKTDDDVASWAKTVAKSDNHVTGTLAMMPSELGGVVDTRLKVYGLENVRVVDASIIPFPISAHLESTVYMIAERAADFIKEDSHLHISQRHKV